MHCMSLVIFYLLDFCSHSVVDFDLILVSSLNSPKSQEISIYILVMSSLACVFSFDTLI